MRSVKYNEMVNYNVSIPKENAPMFESLFKKYNVIAEPTVVAEPVEEYIPNEETIRAIEEGRREYREGLLKGYKNLDELFSDLDDE